MNTTKMLHLVVLCAVGIVSTLASHAAAQPREVTLTVAVRTMAGEPLSDVGIGGRTASGVWRTSTDDAGHATAQVTLSPDEREIVARVWMRTSPDMPPEERRAMHERFFHLTRDYTFQGWYEVAVAEGQNTATLDIQVQPALKVTGRVVDDAGAPIPATVIARGTAWPIRTGDDGEFTVGGLPTGQTARMFFLANAAIVTQLLVPLGVTDQSIGDVVIEPVQGDGIVRITVTNASSLDRRREAKGGGVTLISEDGETILTYLPDPETGLAIVGYSDPSPPSVPAGVYYVVPGLFMATTEQLAVLDAVRAQGDLQAMGVPTVTVIAGQEAVLEVNAAQVEAAIRQAVPGGP